MATIKITPTAGRSFVEAARVKNNAIPDRQGRFLIKRIRPRGRRVRARLSGLICIEEKVVNGSIRKRRRKIREVDLLKIILTR